MAHRFPFFICCSHKNPFEQKARPQLCAVAIVFPPLLLLLCLSITRFIIRCTQQSII
jgi:hypothetical protein